MVGQRDKKDKIFLNAQACVGARVCLVSLIYYYYQYIFCPVCPVVPLIYNVRLSRDLLSDISLD